MELIINVIMFLIGFFTAIFIRIILKKMIVKKEKKDFNKMYNLGKDFINEKKD